MTYDKANNNGNDKANNNGNDKTNDHNNDSISHYILRHGDKKSNCECGFYSFLLRKMTTIKPITMVMIKPITTVMIKPMTITMMKPL